MGISKGAAKKPKAAAAEAPPWPAPPPQADTEDQQGLFSMLHTLAQQLEAQKARADVCGGGSQMRNVTSARAHADGWILDPTLFLIHLP